jgi:hypothetical protein
MVNRREPALLQKRPPMEAAAQRLHQDHQDLQANQDKHRIVQILPAHNVLQVIIMIPLE